MVDKYADFLFLLFLNFLIFTSFTFFKLKIDNKNIKGQLLNILWTDSFILFVIILFFLFIILIFLKFSFEPIKNSSSLLFPQSTTTVTHTADPQSTTVVLTNTLRLPTSKCRIPLR